ncbi:unnamed protein product [Didymodactylos carnosus]|uniref:ADP-ribosylglycohydrolase n=1 Tax=Didymodactylos carnosus TaxID=1234261 RepID=A0A814RPT8_9BILA|nr:unnamed protein product [Didymodactylos carnosus]CAF3900609.1 unnamed protein product [Didymodactylos carnosus]
MSSELAEWLNERKLPHEYKCPVPEGTFSDTATNQIQGSLVGLALGDALGAHVEFRPRTFLVHHPVTDLEGGGTWGLNAGQWTDDTSMALCLATSLVVKGEFYAYDQLVRYKRWWKEGYMSSTGNCFDIGNATQESLNVFYQRQMGLQNRLDIPSMYNTDSLSRDIIEKAGFNVFCSKPGVAGNGALMRLAPVPLFFYRSPNHAIEYAGISGRLTHGDEKAGDACRYYASLICAAMSGFSREDLLDNKFYQNCFRHGWFGERHLHDDVLRVAQGSYKKKGGYDDGIRGNGYIIAALEAALWALWMDEGSFKRGALLAVNLGDDTDTTAAIYGQLAGACYGLSGLPQEWVKRLYGKEFICCLGFWLELRGNEWTTRLSSAVQNAPHWKEQLRHHAKQQVSAQYGYSKPQNEKNDNHQAFHKHGSPQNPKLVFCPNGYESDSSLDTEIYHPQRRIVNDPSHHHMTQLPFTYEDRSNPYGHSQPKKSSIHSVSRIVFVAPGYAPRATDRTRHQQ